MMGSEGAADGTEVYARDLVFALEAEKVNAGLWTLEHRFYGESQPFP